MYMYRSAGERGWEVGKGMGRPGVSGVSSALVRPLQQPSLPLQLVAFTPLAGCDALFVQVLGGPPPDDRLHVGASLHTCARATCVR